MARDSRAHDVTETELRVIQWLPTSLSFAEIGAQLEIPEATVKSVATGLYRRLRVVNRREAVQLCVRLGLLDADQEPEMTLVAQPQQEAMLSSLEDLDEAVFQMGAVRDAEGRIIDFEYRYCNRAGLAVLGRRRHDVIGQRLLELFPSHVTDGLFDAYVKVTETGEPLRYEFSFDERGVVGEFEVVVSRHGDGYVLAGHDISVRKRRERDLVLVQDQLQSALTSRVVIEQAKGYAAALAGTDPETAFNAMRQHARDNNKRLTDVARSIVTGDLDVSAIGGGG
jgi:PAS domain S-box-containing protein